MKQRWRCDWMIWYQWFGLGIIERRGDWYYAIAAGPLLVELWKEPHR